jgi:Rrf2 family nitric oxide-sensitive transcriptional repressor
VRLTLHTDYALRLLMLLALEPDDLHTVEEVARRYGISHHHMNKVVQTLAQQGFVESVRGRGGGVRLARAADKINVGAVVRATEDNFDIVECFNASKNTCVATPACGMRGPLQEALGAFLAVLDKYTLADLMRSPAATRRMHRLLRV